MRSHYIALHCTALFLIEFLLILVQRITKAHRIVFNSHAPLNEKRRLSPCRRPVPLDLNLK